MNFFDRLKQIRLLALDVDGVLTDGNLYLGERGEPQKKTNTLDGYGIKLLIDAGFKIALISGLKSELVAKRFERLGVLDLYFGRHDKFEILNELCHKYDISMSNIAYMGDDLVDMQAMQAVGCAIAVQNSIAEIKNVSHFTTRKSGGEGAVREIIDLLLQVKKGIGKTAIIIPARMESSRFPGKPLVPIQGVPLILRVGRQALSANIGDVFIATDSREISEVASCNGMTVIQTRTDHRTGSDRCAEAIEELDCDFVINLQCDQPGLDPAILSDINHQLITDATYHVVTACSPIRHSDNFQNPDVVKVVRNNNEEALYFSRSLIPHDGNKSIVMRHIGIYGFTRNTLLDFAGLKTSSLEEAEKLEQLRALENGWRIKVLKFESSAPDIDRPADVSAFEKWLQTNG